MKKIFRYQQITSDGLQTVAVIEAPNQSIADTIAFMGEALKKAGRENIRASRIRHFPFYSKAPRNGDFRYMFFQ